MRGCDRWCAAMVFGPAAYCRRLAAKLGSTSTRSGASRRAWQSGFDFDRAVTQCPRAREAGVGSIALTFLAHPDDAEILCGGTLVRLAAAGWNIHIATATAGDCGTTS